MTTNGYLNFKTKEMIVLEIFLQQSEKGKAILKAKHDVKIINVIDDYLFLDEIEYVFECLEGIEEENEGFYNYTIARHKDNACDKGFYWNIVNKF